jgi:hypothetical protein
MRIGQNPLRNKRAIPLPQIVACAITHLPNFKSYHETRLEVIQTCLRTMRDNSDLSLSTYIWDNGSCLEFRDWLQFEYKPDFLTLSPNIGKASARSSIVRAFPPETVVCVTDDDMYFYPGWLGPQLELLNGFPNVGVVSGYPVRTQFRWGVKSTLEWARNNANLKIGEFIPDEWDRDFCDSIGRDYTWHRNYTKDDKDALIEYKGLKAYATAHHCQFICKAGAIDYIVQWDGETMSDEKKFDNAIDSEGFLRLTTIQRLTQHIGNVLDEKFKIQELNYGIIN